MRHLLKCTGTNILQIAPVIKINCKLCSTERSTTNASKATGKPLRQLFAVTQFGAEIKHTGWNICTNIRFTIRTFRIVILKFMCHKIRCPFNLRKFTICAEDVITQMLNAGRNISFFQSLHPTECTIANRSNAFRNMYFCNLVEIGFPWTQIFFCANICIRLNSIIIGHWAIASNSQNLCRFIVFPLNTLFLILCITITRGFCFAFGAILASNSGCLRSFGARSLCKRRNSSSRHHGNCHAHCQGGADHSF